MVAGHHPQSMTVVIVEEDQDDIETETPVQRQDPSVELVAVKEVIEEKTGTEMKEMRDLMLGVEVLKLQHQEIHQEATQEHSY